MSSTKSGQITLHGRFNAGAQVRLVRVEDETVLRPEGGKEVASATVDDDGRVQFKKGVEVGGRYFIVGQRDGFPLEVPVRGRSADDDNAVLSQPPVRPDRVRLADGRWQDEVVGAKRVAPPSSEVGPAPGQHQVPKGTQQRSDTPLGTATPVDPKERPPFPLQDSVKKNEPQRSDTERGQATPVPHQAPPAQDDVKGRTAQRSDTPRGTATPIPGGDAIDAVRDRENATTKAAVGEPGKAAALPVDVSKAPPARRSAKKRSTAKKSSGPSKTKAASKSTSRSSSSRKSSRKR
jgi:hypothetical protein